MDMEKPQSLEDIAIAVDDLVRSSNSISMEIFRNQCKIGYSKVQKRFDEYLKEIIANKEKPVQKLSDELTKKLREKFASKPSLFEYLFFPQSYYDPKMAHAENVYGKPGGTAPYNKELGLLADYIRLTILHDRYLESTGTEPINNGIWSETESSETESWAEELWKIMKKGWDMPRVVDIFYLSYKRVKEDLTVQEETQTKDKGGQDENWHNDDFTEVRWNGKRYKFDKPQQALSVGYLWNNKRAREKSIGEAIGSEADNFRLIHIFRQSGKKAKMHPAWGAMIVSDGKGIYALAESKKAPQK